jgi:hypothetical protein
MVSCRYSGESLSGPRSSSHGGLFVCDRLRMAVKTNGVWNEVVPRGSRGISSRGSARARTDAEPFGAHRVLHHRGFEHFAGSRHGDRTTSLPFSPGLALELVAVAVMDAPPRTSESPRANDALLRYTPGADPPPPYPEPPHAVAAGRCHPHPTSHLATTDLRSSATSGDHPRHRLRPHRTGCQSRTTIPDRRAAEIGGP